MDMSLSKLWEMVKDRETCHAAVHGGHKSQTRLTDNNNKSWHLQYFEVWMNIFLKLGKKFGGMC